MAHTPRADADGRLRLRDLRPRHDAGRPRGSREAGNAARRDGRAHGLSWALRGPRRGMGPAHELDRGEGAHAARGPLGDLLRGSGVRLRLEQVAHGAQPAADTRRLVGGGLHTSARTRRLVPNGASAATSPTGPTPGARNASASWPGA